MIEEKLRDWAAAERIAIQAEEHLRAALREHLNGAGPLPTLQMQMATTNLGSEADALFKEIQANL